MRSGARRTFLLTRLRAWPTITRARRPTRLSPSSGPTRCHQIDIKAQVKTPGLLYIGKNCIKLLMQRSAQFVLQRVGLDRAPSHRPHCPSQRPIEGPRRVKCTTTGKPQLSVRPPCRSFQSYANLPNGGTGNGARRPKPLATHHRPIAECLLGESRLAHAGQLGDGRGAQRFHIRTAWMPQGRF